MPSLKHEGAIFQLLAARIGTRTSLLLSVSNQLDKLDCFVIATLRIVIWELKGWLLFCTINTASEPSTFFILFMWIPRWLLQHFFSSNNSWQNWHSYFPFLIITSSLVEAPCPELFAVPWWDDNMWHIKSSCWLKVMVHLWHFIVSALRTSLGFPILGKGARFSCPEDIDVSGKWRKKKGKL